MRPILWTLLLLLSSFSPMPAFAQAGFFAAELGTDPEKLVDRTRMDMMSMGRGSESGSGPKPYLPALGAVPKRVALVSYYSLDIGNYEENGPYARAATGWYISQSIDITGAGLALFNQALHDAGIEAMKKAFAAHGMELLTPPEYLDTDGKKAAYDAFKLETGGKGSLTGILNKMNKAEFKLTDAAQGYHLIDLPRLNASNEAKFGLALQGGSKPVFEGLGHDLAAALGVDAVMVVYNVLQADKKSINMIGNYAYVFGPNPVPSTGQSLYWSGHQYSGAWMKLEVPLVNGKGDEAAYDFDGTALVAGAVAERTARFIADGVAGR
jgi:hypothetical protein